MVRRDKSSGIPATGGRDSEKYLWVNQPDRSRKGAVQLSMLIKQKMEKSRSNRCSARPARHGKDWIVRNLIPSGTKEPRRYSDWNRRPHVRALIVWGTRNSAGGTTGYAPVQGMKRLPTSRSIRTGRPKHGIAYGARALWRRSPHSSPRTGKPSTWRRGTGNLTPDKGGMRNAER